MAMAHEIKRRMEEIQAAREAAFNPLLEILVERQELLRKLAELDEPYGKAFSEAEAAGWTADELTTIGAEEPAKRPKGRPRNRRTAPKNAAAETTSPISSTNSPTSAVPAQEAAREIDPAASGSTSI